MEKKRRMCHQEDPEGVLRDLERKLRLAKLLNHQVAREEGAPKRLKPLLKSLQQRKKRSLQQSRISNF
jgi:hypothetical protein